jgi:hypothetical protein
MDQYEEIKQDKGTAKFSCQRAEYRRQNVAGLSNKCYKQEVINNFSDPWYIKSQCQWKQNYDFYICRHKKEEDKE